MNDIERFPADWSELPGDLLGLIIEKNFSLSDYIRIGAVCYQWRFFFTENYEHIKLSSRLPVLLIPNIDDTEQKKKPRRRLLGNGRRTPAQNYYNPKEMWYGQDQNRHKSTRSLYSLFEKKVYKFQLPVPYINNCRGSSHGWLVTVEEDENYSVKLLNPFRSFNNEIQLPPLTTCKQAQHIHDSFFMTKACISANPWPSSSIKPDDDVVIIGIYGFYRLGYCRPGDKSWTSLPYKWKPIQDIIYYKAKIYAINQQGLVVSFDVGTSASPLIEPKVTVIAQPPKRNSIPQMYLVERSGDLLQVHRSYDDNDKNYSTTGFKVFKLLSSSNTWARVKHLKGFSLFLGDNSSMSVYAADFPGCKPDCIYFTDDFRERYLGEPSFGPHDLGVFNLVNGSIQQHYPVKKRSIINPAPIWIQPTL